MMGFRFSLVLDFGMDTAARARYGVRRREDSAQRMEEGRRAAAPCSMALRRCEELGRGPLEPEDFGQELAEPMRSRRPWQ